MYINLYTDVLISRPKMLSYGLIEVKDKFWGYFQTQWPKRVNLEIYIHKANTDVSVLAFIFRPQRLLLGLLEVKGQFWGCFLNLWPKNLGFDIHQALYEHFNFGIYLEAEEASKRPPGGQYH